MKNLQIALPFWVRAILLVGVICILAGAGLTSYRLLHAAEVTGHGGVGWLDGEAKQVASLIASRLATTDAPIRLKVVNAGSVLDAAKASMPARPISPWSGPMSAISSGPHRCADRAWRRDDHRAAGIADHQHRQLRDHTVGVVGGEINHGSSRH